MFQLYRIFLSQTSENNNMDIQAHCSMEELENKCNITESNKIFAECYVLTAKNVFSGNSTFLILFFFKLGIL